MVWQWGLVFTVAGYVATLFLIPWVLLTPKRQPVASVAWILTIVMVPLLGGVLFLIFGINRVNRRTERKRRASRTIGRLLPELTRYAHHHTAEEDAHRRRLMKLTRGMCDTLPLRGNRIEVLNDTNRTLGLITEAIRDAQESIHLEYYIWQPDKTGTQLRDRLIEKAREGIAIRFLYDGVGSMWLGRKFLQPMEAAGISVSSFLPGASLRERWSLNLRNHRKIVVVDGKTGFTGGMNIGDEYLGKNPQLGYWRDTHLRVQGPCVLQLQSIFAEDWYYATGEELTGPKMFPSPSEGGGALAQVVAGEPRMDHDVLFSLMFAAINDAQRTVMLTTSYFVPPPALLVALETAAQRGVKVRILVPSRAEYQWTVWAARSYYRTLLAAGAEIYEYQRGQLHSKVLTVDGQWALVGTPNFDARSLELNFEVAIAAYDRRIAGQLDEQFEHDLKWTKQIEWEEWVRRPRRTELLQNFCRLFSPVL